MSETTYVVLRQRNAEASVPHWEVANKGVDALNADHAIRLACKKDQAPAGTYVAIPARSWKPVTVKAETTTVLRLESVGGEEA